MQVTVGAFTDSIPKIVSTSFACGLLWLVFAIIGVAAFKAKFYKCLDIVTGERLSNDVVINRTACSNKTNGIWVNSRVHFDNVPMALLGLLQVRNTLHIP